MELVSVLLPTYNVEKFVEEAVESLLKQTYPNLEIIVVDDASTDNTYAILETLKKKDSRIRLFRNERNLKIAETLNFAFSMSKGKYILRMDGDDISHPDRVKRLYEYLCNNREYDLIGNNTITIDEKGREIGNSKFPIKEELVYKGLKFRMSPVAHIWLATRSLYEKVGPYRLPPVEDYDFLLRAKTLGFRFTNIDEFLYKVRIRKGNTATSQGLSQRISADHVFKLYQERLQFGYEKKYNFEKIKTTRIFKFNNLFHQRSNYFLSKAIGSRKNPIKFSFLVITAIVLSPLYQTKFLYFRYRAKAIT